MESVRLLFLLTLCISFSVADDCLFLNSCNATLPSSEPNCWNCTSEQKLPTSESTIIFQSVDDMTLSNLSLVVRDIFVRDSRILWRHSNVSSIRFTIENSDFALGGSTLNIQEHLSVQSSSDEPSSLKLYDSVVSSNTSLFNRTKVSFLPGVSNLNTFNSTFSLLMEGTLYIDSNVIWNGHLDSSASTFGASASHTMDTQVAVTSWTIRNSTLLVDAFTFSLPMVLEHVTSNPPSSEGPIFDHEVTITSSIMQHITRCSSCRVSNSSLYNIPEYSILHLSGSIQIFGEPTYSSGTTLFGSPGLTIDSASSINLNATSLIGPFMWHADTFTFVNCLFNSTSPSIGNSSLLNATTIEISNSTIHGAWSLVGEEENGLRRTNGTSTLHLVGPWFLSMVRAKDVTLDEMDTDGHRGPSIVIDADRLIIRRLVVSMYNYYITLSNTTSYTIQEIYLTSGYLYSTTPVRGGIPTDFLDSLRTDSDCSTYVKGSSLSVHYNTTALYVMYVPPTPDITYGWSNGISTYFHFDEAVSYWYYSYCTDDALVYHNLIIEDNGSHRIITSSPTGDTYWLPALSGQEDGCTHKRVKAYL
ncbi:hypothetical protein PROFUN_16569, partial [Planoprotostelium fungivorum]